LRLPFKYSVSPRIDKSILIVSSSDDLHALAVRRELNHRGCNAFLLASDELNSHEFRFEFDSDPQVALQSRSISVASISTIWWRRPALNQRLPDNAFTDDQVDFINKNSMSTLRSFLTASFDGKWISTPEATDRAADKLYQLQVARKHGFRVPDTLISNDPEAVKQFHDRHDGRIIIKAARNSGRVFLSTRQVDLEKLSDEQIRAVPSIYQELIPGSYHLRVNCFGRAIHAALIETDALDWRPDINVPIRRYVMNADLEDRITALLEAFDLKVGVMDLKISGPGDLVWFEVNPQGQFLFLEPLTGQNLLSHFTDFLLSG
jgi:glutathione synthase/RimK-type ligase-like ATP-grasp enzyme